jgi:hypothetical protein
MNRRRRSQISPYIPLLSGILATLCAYFVLFVIRKAMCSTTAMAIKATGECAFSFPPFVMNLPLAFFIAGGISTIVLLVWRDRQG